MELVSSEAVQSDGGALGEGGGAEPGRHGSVGGHLVGRNWRPRQGLQGGRERGERPWDLVKSCGL